MATSYSIKDGSNSRSKLLLVSSLLASSMAFATEPNIIQAESKADIAPIGSGEVSSDVAEKLFMNMNNDFQKSQIEKLNIEMATLEQSHEKQKEIISSRLAELQSGLLFQSLKANPTPKNNQLENSNESSQIPSDNTVTQPLAIKKTDKAILPMLIPKVSSLKVKSSSAAQFNNATVNFTNGYNTAQINNATIKSLTNKDRMTSSSQQPKIQEAKSKKFQAVKPNNTSTADTPISTIAVTNFLKGKKIGAQKKDSKKVTESIKPLISKNVEAASRDKKKAVKKSSPLVDEQGELLAIQPGSVTLNHEYHTVSTKPTAEPTAKGALKTKVSKLIIKPTNQKPIPQKPVSQKPMIKPVGTISASIPTTRQLERSKPSVAKTSTIKRPEMLTEASPSMKSTKKTNSQQRIVSSAPSALKDNPIASELYLTALQAFSVEQTDTAIRELRQYINTYPNESLIAKAHYWLGEAYLQKEPANYAAARFEFIEVIDRYNKHPNNDKQLKSLYRLSQLSKINNYDDDLKLYTQMLQDIYPTAKETQQAMELLDR